MPGRQQQSLMREVATKADAFEENITSRPYWDLSNELIAAAAYAMGVREALLWASGASVPSDILSDIMAQSVEAQ